MLTGFNKLGRILLTSVFLFTSSACSLINPHVTWKKPELQPGHSSLEEGVLYAHNAMEAYKGAIADQSRLNNLLPLLLIPLGAASLAMGIDGANPTAIAALGLTGAAAFGVGNFWSSKPRQLVYAAGMKAIVCAKDAMLPLDFSSVEHGIFRTDLSDLRTELSTVDTTGMNEDEKAAVTKAKEVLQSGDKLFGEISRASGALVSAVDRIDVEVNKAIVTTIPDLQAISTIVGGLAKTSAQFTPIPDGSKKGAKSPSPGERSLVEPETQTQINNIRVLTSKVGAVVSQVASASPLESLKECNVESVATAFKVQPPSPISLQTGQAQVLIIEGGKPPYTADLLEPTTALEVIRPVAFDNHVSVTLKEAAGKSQYRLYIADSASHSIILDLETEKKPDSPPIPPPTPDPSASKKKKKAKNLGTEKTPGSPLVPRTLPTPSSSESKTKVH